MNIENNLDIGKEELYFGKLIKEYSCGCIKREGSRGYCIKHWRGYFAGIKTPENKSSEPPDYIDEDYCY